MRDERYPLSPSDSEVSLHFLSVLSEEIMISLIAPHRLPEVWQKIRLFDYMKFKIILGGTIWAPPSPTCSRWR